jgi:hypothetical protein
MKGRATDFRADMRFDLCLISGEVKARSTVEAVGIEKRHRGLVKMRADAHELLGQGSTFEEAECGTGVKFDERHRD